MLTQHNIIPQRVGISRIFDHGFIIRKLVEPKQ